jgi:hypothetical protein
MPFKNAAAPETPKPKLILLEHDNRFAVFPEFVFYDFAQPLKLPGPSLSHPFWSQEESLTNALKSQPQRHLRPHHLRPALPQRRLPT